jgi:8-oxo-dGTP diphosphatase
MPQTDHKIIEIDGKKYYAYNFPRPSVTVDHVIFGIDTNKRLDEPGNRLKVLLIKRKNPPFQNCWALPGGFVDMDETISDASIREVLEETGIDLYACAGQRSAGAIHIFVGVFDAPERDPRGRVISHAYSSVIDINSVNPKAADDAQEVAWCDVTECSEIAFDHGAIIEQAIKKLDSKFLAKIILGQFV